MVSETRLTKLHYNQLPTTITTITERNIERQKTTQNVPDGLDKGSTQRNDERTTN